ncbi:MAG: tetratricopeptide repeat protein [Bacteroidales bacterium]|nr:tetratricopeptide repeat protein [Candidatus Latescibacterota bacterium]
MPQLNDNEKDILLSFASRVDRNDPGALNNLGVLYYRKGIYDEAIAQFKEALKIDSRFDLARENLQYLFAETKMEDPDVSRWKKEVESDPGNDEALLRLGVSYQNMGWLKEASETLGEVVAKNPDHYMARIHLGTVLKARGLHQQALEHYLCASDKVRKSAVFFTDLGEIYYNLGRTDEAITELMAAIKLDADYWRSHFLLSFAYGDIGHFQEAIEEGRIASKLNPSFQNTEANLALSNFKDGDQDPMASAMGKEIPSLESTSFTLGVAYRERGYYKEALQELNKALSDMPEKDRVYIELGKIHMSESNEKEALTAFLKALEENTENAEAFRLCGCIYHLQGHYRKAGICYLQAFRLNSGDADTMNNLGVLLYQAGLYEDAERMFKKGLNLSLYNLELNYNFLTCNLLKEEYLMAENLIQRLEAFVGKSPMLYEKRAILHYKLNRMTLALFDIESALTFDKNHADALYLKGLIFLREENFHDAIESILGAASICSEYRGFHFFLAVDENVKADPVRIEKTLSGDPDDELIEILQAGVHRRFDKIREFLMAVVEDGIKEVESGEIAGGVSRADAPGNAPEHKDKNSSAIDVAEEKSVPGENGDAVEVISDSDNASDEETGIDLLEEIRFDI